MSLAGPAARASPAGRAAVCPCPPAFLPLPAPGGGWQPPPRGFPARSPAPGEAGAGRAGAGVPRAGLLPPPPPPGAAAGAGSLHEDGGGKAKMGGKDKTKPKGKAAGAESVVPARPCALPVYEIKDFLCQDVVRLRQRRIAKTFQMTSRKQAGVRLKRGGGRQQRHKAGRYPLLGTVCF